MQTTRRQHRFMAFLPRGFDSSHLLIGGVFQCRHFNFPITAQQNVGTATGHVGGNRHRARTPGLRDNFGFFVVVFGVQYLVLNARVMQQTRHMLGAFNGRRTHQHRTPCRLARAHVFNNGGKFFFLGEVNQVVEIFTRHRAMRRDDDNIQAINLLKFKGFGVSGAGHAA